MKTENNNLKKTALASGAAILTTFGLGNVNAAELLNFEDLGTASELRSSLITADALNSFTSNTDVEFECGEGKCGEGKCGEKAKKKDDTKKSEKASMKPASESGASESGTMKASESKSTKGSMSETKPAKKEKKAAAPAETPNN